MDYWLGDFLENVPTELPMIVICLAGLIVVVSLRKRLGRGAVWGSIGFALLLLISVAIPASQTLASYLIGYQGLEPSSLVFPLLWLIWSSVRAIGCGCLLVAIVIRREKN